IVGNCDGELLLATASAVRPPQPVAPIPCEISVCHCVCWSEGEKRFSGTVAVRFLYCVRVMGRINGPTIATIAIWLLLKRDCMDVNCGCNPYCVFVVAV